MFLLQALENLTPQPPPSWKGRICSNWRGHDGLVFSRTMIIIKIHIKFIKDPFKVNSFKLGAKDQVNRISPSNNLN